MGQEDNCHLRPARRNTRHGVGGRNIRLPPGRQHRSKRGPDIRQGWNASLRHPAGDSGLQNGYLIELEGFTDNIGTEKTNLGLSDRRVESVLRYLVSKRVPLYRISLVGLGKADPVSDNQTAAGREQNRRVEIRVLQSSDSVSTAAR